MKNTWDDLFINLDNFATNMKEFFTKVPQSPVFHKEIKQLERRWKAIQKCVDKFEKEFNPANPIIIKIPDEFNSLDFADAWEHWKGYLAEQHNIIMLTRMEADSLELLLELCEGDKKEAIYMLKFASSGGYPKFFKVNRNNINNPKQSNDGRSIDPDLED